MRRILATSLVLFSSLSFASVFSNQGTGLRTTFPQTSAGRAGMGLALFDSIQPNLMQPAAFAELTEVRFTSGMQVQQRVVTEKTASATATANQTESMFGGFGLSFPLVKRYRMGIISAPHSRVATRNTGTGVYAGNEYRDRRDGSGGLTRTGVVFGLNAGKWRWGLETGIINGSINHGWQLYFDQTGWGDGWYVMNRRMLGSYAKLGSTFQTGTSRHSLYVMSPVTLHVGDEISYAMSERKINSSTTMELPLELGYGLGIAKGRDRYGIEYHFQQWSQVSNTPSAKARRDGWTTGAYWDRTGISVTALESYWKKVGWRAGIRYSSIALNTATLSDVSEVTVAAGAALPIKRSANRCDVAVGFTHRATSTDYLAENEFWTSVSVSISDKWFLREKPVRRKR